MCLLKPITSKPKIFPTMNLIMALTLLACLLYISFVEPAETNPEPAHVSVFEHFASYYSIQGFYHVAIPIDFKSFHTACTNFHIALDRYEEVQKLTVANPQYKSYNLKPEIAKLTSLQTELDTACADVAAWPGPPSQTGTDETQYLNATRARINRSPHILAMKFLKFAGTSLGYFGLNYLWDKIIGTNDAQIVALENKVEHLSQNLLPLLSKVHDLTESYNTHISYYMHAKQLEKLADTVHRFTAQIQTINLLWATLLTSNRLSPNFMRPSILATLHGQIEDLLQERDHILFIRSPYQLLELPVTVIHKDSKTFVLIHVPLVDQKMDLHRLVPLPLWLKAKGGEDNEVLDIITNTPFIAVSERGVFNSPLTRTQLDACLPIGANYFCAHPSYLKQFQSSCIGALFAGGLEIALEHCATVRSKTTLVVQDTAAGYVIFTKTEITVFQKCQLSPVQAFTFQGYRLFPFKEKCALHSGEIFVPELIPTTLNFSKTLIASVVPEFLGLEWDEYLQQRAALEVEALPLPRDPGEVTARYEANASRNTRSTWTLTLALLSAISTMLIFTLLGVKFLLLRQAQRLSLSAASTHHSGSFEMEAIITDNLAERLSLVEHALGAQRRRRPSV